MSTKANKRNIVVECEYFRKNIKKNRNELKTQKEEEDIDLDTLLQQQRIKEKQLLKQWKDVRDTEKKIRFVMRSQSRDNSVREKQCFVEKSQEDYAETDYVWKHDGCNNECKQDKCMWWKLEAGIFS